MHFNTPIIIVGQGEVYEPLLAEMAQDYPVIALDGAVHQLRALGLVPVAVIGDMDSISPQDKALDDVTIISHSEQDSNDFEKALYSLEAPFIYGFGLCGKRFDQTMANLHVMAKYHAQAAMMAITPFEVISLHQGAVKLKTKAQEPMAILPLAPISFAYSRGLAFELDGLVLAMGQMVSSSNQALSEMVEIVPAESDLDKIYAVCRSHHVLADRR